MQEIKTTLAELDADIATAKGIGAWSVNKEAVGEKVTAWISTMLGVESKLPAIRAYIEKLEREAEAGRALAERYEKTIKEITSSPKLVDDDGDDHSYNVEFLDVFNAELALSSYHSATRDITSKE